MAFHHLAHLKSFKRHIKKGTKISRGDDIGNVGNTGTRYAHCHYEVMKIRPDHWTQYNNGMTKEQTEARYADPYKWIDQTKKIPAPYTTFGGWDFLDVRDREGNLHPGVDINDGYGDDDLGNNIKSPCDGEVVYIGRLEGGWGNHIWIYEDDGKPYPTVDWEFAKKHAGKFFLQVQEHGEIWWIDPDGKKHFIGGTPEEMLEFVKKWATGITNSDLNKFPK
tara:strand:- start:2493 stop:3155 length:663 start_codon:yes stop_codon:yes gene_type:complete